MKKSMGKTLIIIGIVLAALLVLAALVYFLVPLFAGAFKKPEPVKPAESNELISVCYNSAGGMSGGVYCLDLSVDNKNPDKVILTFTNKEWHNSKTKDKVYKFTRDVFTQFAELTDADTFAAWEKSPRSEFEVLDAPTSSVTFVYADGRSYRIADWQELPDEAWTFFHQVKEMLEALTK